MSKSVVRPLSSGQGYGFFSLTALPDEMVNGYRHEVTGRYNNYHCTSDRWQWPIDYELPKEEFVIDGFAPNLNKLLHAGHLRQLALANSLQEILKYHARFVGMFGAQIGIKKMAVVGLNQWLNFVGYKPEVYYDVLMPHDVVLVRTATEHDGVTHDYIKPSEDGKYPEVWDGPNGPVIVKTSDGRFLYAHHDLAFANEVRPTHYITDHGQGEHFARLGLGDKHLPMGLVLGKNGNSWGKLKSRTGDAMTADEIMEAVISRLEETKEPRQLAWNVLVWNFLHVSRRNDVRFELDKWTDPDSAGLYITYIWARINRALGGFGKDDLHLVRQEILQEKCDYQPIDVELLAIADQHKYYRQQAISNFDPAPLANFAHDLARKLGMVYHGERIRNGRPSHYMAVRYASTVLESVMRWLGMFNLLDV